MNAQHTNTQRAPILRYAQAKERPMKQQYLLALLFMATLTTACVTTGNTTTPSTNEHNPVRIVSNAEVHFNKMGVMLVSARIHEERGVESGLLANHATLPYGETNIMLRKGTRVFFFEDGTLAGRNFATPIIITHDKYTVHNGTLDVPRVVRGLSPAFMERVNARIRSLSFYTNSVYVDDAIQRVTFGFNNEGDVAIEKHVIPASNSTGYGIERGVQSSVVIVNTRRNVLTLGAYMGYWGGAHPNHTFSYITYDTLLEKEVSLYDEVREHVHVYTFISNLCMETIRKEKERRDITSGLAEWTDNIVEAGTIGMLRNRFSVFYPPYAIGAYVEGSYEVDIPYDRFPNIANEFPMLRRMRSEWDVTYRTDALLVEGVALRFMGTFTNRKGEVNPRTLTITRRGTNVTGLWTGRAREGALAGVLTGDGDLVLAAYEGDVHVSEYRVRRTESDVLSGTWHDARSRSLRVFAIALLHN